MSKVYNLYYSNILFVFFLLLGSYFVNINCANSKVKHGQIVPIGSVAMKLKDFPINDVNVLSVMVNIRKIEIHSDDKGWVKVIDYNEVGRFFDLLQLQGGRTADLGYFQLPVGTYSQIRLYLNDKNMIVYRDSAGAIMEAPLKVPSGIQTGVKFVREFHVVNEGVTELLVDFDASRSILFNKGVGYSLKPTIKVENVSTTPGATKLIKAKKGGQITLINDITVTIPPGALDEDTYISIQPVEEPELSEGGNRFIAMKNYVILPEGLTLNNNAEISIHYDPTFLEKINYASGNNVLNEYMLDIGYYDEVSKSYKSNGRQIDINNKVVTTATNHFSLWSLAVVILGGDVKYVADYPLDWGTTSVQYVTGPNNQPLDIGAAQSYYEKTYLPGTAMDLRLFHKSFEVAGSASEVVGYCTVGIAAKAYKDLSFGAYVFFHACQRHDRCDSAGEMTYNKTYAYCNVDMDNDMEKTCLRFTDPELFVRCQRARSHLKAGLDTHLAAKNNKLDKTLGNSCMDYDRVYLDPAKTHPNFNVNDPTTYYYDSSLASNPKYMSSADAGQYQHVFSYCSGSNLNVDALINDPRLANIFPKEVVNISLDRRCPFLEPGEIVLNWNYPSSSASLDNIDAVSIARSKRGPISFLGYIINLWMRLKYPDDAAFMLPELNPDVELPRTIDLSGTPFESFNGSPLITINSWTDSPVRALVLGESVLYQINSIHYFDHDGDPGTPKIKVLSPGRQVIFYRVNPGNACSPSGLYQVVDSNNNLLYDGVD